MPTYGVSAIFTIGLTAALAWELPHEPIHFKSDKTKSDADKRIDQNKTIPLIKPVATPIVYKPFRPSPVTVYQPWTKIGWSQLQPHTAQFMMKQRAKVQSIRDKSNNAAKHGYYSQSSYLPPYRNKGLYRKYGEVHRRTRRDLFEKIEKFFAAQNKNGRQCLLKALCEVNQINDVQRGSFMDEIFKAIFTWRSKEEEDNDEYNKAATYKKDCTEKYINCTQSVWNNFL